MALAKYRGVPNRPRLTVPKDRGGSGFFGKRNRDLIFLGKLAPKWEEANDPRYKGYMLTRGQKLGLAREYTLRDPVPLCIDHAGGDDPSFVVPPEKIIGYVTSFLVDRNDDLFITGYIDGKRPEMRKIIADMQLKRARWGLSAYTRFLYENTRRDTVIPDSKRITHVGVTLDPAFRDEKTWIFEYSTNPDAIARIIREREIQQHGCLANAELLDACGVAPNVKQHVLSVLNANIAQPYARPTERALPPAPEYPALPGSDSPPSNTENTSPSTIDMSSSASSSQSTPSGATGTNTSTNTATKPSSATPDSSRTADPMEGVTSNNTAPTGSTETGKPSNTAPSAEVMSQIVAAFVDATKKVEAFPSPLARHKEMESMIGKVDQALKENNLTPGQMPEEFNVAYWTTKNKCTLIRQDYAKEVEKLGTAENQFNKDFVDKILSNGTNPQERERLMGFVEATSAKTTTSQKAAEAERARLQKENEEKDRMIAEITSSKRKAEDDMTKLREEYDRLKRRNTETANVARTAQPALGANPFNFYSAPPPMSQQQQPNQNTSQNMSPFNFGPTISSTPPQHSSKEAANMAKHAALGSAGSSSHSLVLDGNNQVVYNSAEQERPLEDRVVGPFRGFESQEGFVSATGFQVAREDHVGSSLGHNWLRTFVLSPEQSSFQQGFDAKTGALNPVFARTYQMLENALNNGGPTHFEQYAFDARPFGYDDKKEIVDLGARMTDAAMFGMNNHQYSEFAKTQQSKLWA